MEDAAAVLRKQLNAGAGALALLARLASAKRPMYGYELAQDLDAAAGPLPMAAGSLYPVLRSLERQGLLTSETQLSDEGRARRYYSLTDEGTAALPAWREAWAETALFLNTILEMPDEKPGKRRGHVVSGGAAKRASQRAAREKD